MITDKKEDELFSKIDKSKWIKSYDEYKLHQAAAEELVEKAYEMGLAIIGLEGYKVRDDGLMVTDFGNIFDFEDIEEIETWKEKVEASYDFYKRIIADEIRPNFKPDDEYYLMFYFDERADLKIVKS